jgi:Trk K+ transport system NAD-binding subunit
MDSDVDRLAILSKQADVTTVWVAEPLIQDYLLQGDVSTVDAFFMLTDDDHKNLLLGQIATHIYNVPKVMCRLTDPQLHDLYQPLGVTILDSGPDFLSSAREFLDQ